MKKNSLKYFIFVLVIFCFVAIPAIILSYSVYSYFQTNEEQIIYNLKSDMQRMASELRRNLLAEKYFCRLFHDYWNYTFSNPNENINDIIDYCKQLKTNYGKEIDFVFLDDKGKVKYNSNPELYNHTAEEWYKAYSYVRANINFLPNSNFKAYKDDIEAIRLILGPQVVVNSFDTIYDESLYSFIWGDSSRRIPPSSVYSFHCGSFFVFASRDLLDGVTHLRFNAIDYSAGKKIITGLYNDKNIYNTFYSSKKIKNVENIQRVMISPEYKSKDFIDAEAYYICRQYLTKDSYIFVMVEKDNTKTGLMINAVLVFLFYFLLSFPIVKYFWNTIILKIPGNASISLKLGFLFLFASGIPLLSLAVVSHEYELHRRISLTEEARVWSVENLLGIEQRYKAYLKKLCNELDNYIDKWAEELKVNELTNDYSQILWEKLHGKGAFDYYCISSFTPVIAVSEGLFKYTGPLESIDFDMKNSVIEKNRKMRADRYKELELANIIIKKVCSDLNKKDIPSTKLELIAENLMQKSFSELIYNIIEVVGEIKEWGFGSKSNMAYFKFISLQNKSTTDYGVLATWRPRDLQASFVVDIIPNANKNDKNFKFIAYEKIFKTFTPKEYGKYNEIGKFARRAAEKPTDELEYITLDGEEYIAVSFLGRSIYRYNFVGLYPVRNIENLIYIQSSLLWLLGVLCLILSIGLAHLLSKSFVNPLQKLQEGALAIESRNFKHRLSGLSVDEFGEVGEIFNHVMVGLEELEIAKIVQESMFPKPEFKQGNFSVYGKSITMIDVGGDYLDFFKVDDNSFSVLLGDVAGHGVGAAVIMAMAKAAILGGGDSLKSPADVLNQLHKMILSTKTNKQKKIMTFQYFYVNSETGENLYGNAGACSPLLIRHSENCVEEIKMGGAALGAFKRVLYSEMSIDFRPGDAIVFYTDGIVECKNKDGEMLGYERLKKIVLESWDVNPETYYNNILKSYYNYVGEDSEAGDDLTFVILAFNKSEGLSEEKKEDQQIQDNH